MVHAVLSLRERLRGLAPEVGQKLANNFGVKRRAAAALQFADRRAADSSPPAEVLLGQALAPSEEPKTASEGCFFFQDGTTQITASTFSCPSGFTAIAAVGRTMGCLQNAEEGTANWATAMDDCFDTYGGRLPATVEQCIAFSNYSFTDETDDEEWIGEGGSGGEATFQPSDSPIVACRPSTSTRLDSKAYRCWIGK